MKLFFNVRRENRLLPTKKKIRSYSKCTDYSIEMFNETFFFFIIASISFETHTHTHSLESKINSSRNRWRNFNSCFITVLLVKCTNEPFLVPYAASFRIAVHKQMISDRPVLIQTRDVIEKPWPSTVQGNRKHKILYTTLFLVWQHIMMEQH